MKSLKRHSEFVLVKTLSCSACPFFLRSVNIFMTIGCLQNHRKSCCGNLAVKVVKVEPPKTSLMISKKSYRNESKNC